MSPLIVLVYLIYIVSSNGRNIVMILTDDQDVVIGGMDQMPKTSKLLVNNGLTFQNSFVSSPICCVSRASILSGRYVHNHGTTNNSIDGNCSSQYWQNEIESTCFAPLVQQQGYVTFYAGKYLNEYGVKAAGGTEWIPFGWTEWKGLVGNSKYYDYNISDNGKNIYFGGNYSTDYYTDVINNQSIQFLNEYGANHSFVMVLAPPASHAIFTPAPQYNITNETAPRTPNFNYTKANINDSDLTKHTLMLELNPMSAEGVYYTDYIYSQRHGTLKSVDDMVENVWNKLEELGILNNTYWIYTSDNGFVFLFYCFLFEINNILINIV